MKDRGTRGRGTALAVAVLAVITMSAACSSSSKKATNTAPASTAAAASPGSSAAPATGTPIKIGFICSCTSPLGSSTAINLPGYQAWVKFTNANGGINGHPIDLIVKDDNGNPATSISDVQELVGTEHVIALASVTNFEAGWASYVEQQKIPVIGGSTVTPEDYSAAGGGWFSQGQTTDSVPAAVVLAAKKVGAKNFGLIYCSEAPVCAQLVGVEQQVGQANGVPLVYKTAVSATAPNYTAQCLAAKQAGAESLFVADAVSVVEAVARDCNKQGYNVRIIAEDGAIAASFKSSPGLSDGFIGIEPVVPFEGANTPGIQQMEAAFKQYAPTLLSNPNYNDEAEEGWVSGLLFAAAAKAGNLGANGTDPTSDQLFTGLYALHNETLGGMAVGLTYKQGAPNPIHCWFQMGTSKGNWTLPAGLTPQCLPS
jgi:branched-chain amino acid transport system substrate-binding protein